MIKVNEMTISGVISKSASLRNDDGKSRVTFRVKVLVPSSTNDNKYLEVFVTKAQPENTDLQDLIEGKQVEVKGVMDIHPQKRESDTKGADPVCFLNCEKVKFTERKEGALDVFTGKLSFIGSVAKAIEEKKGKNDNPFLVFPAFSAEQGKGENPQWFYQYVRFMKFPKKDDTEPLRPEWLKEKSKVEIEGDIQISSYNGRISLTSRVFSIKEHTPKQK